MVFEHHQTILLEDVEGLWRVKVNKRAQELIQSDSYQDHNTEGKDNLHAISKSFFFFFFFETNQKKKKRFQNAVC